MQPMKTSRDQLPHDHFWRGIVTKFLNISATLNRTEVKIIQITDEFWGNCMHNCLDATLKFQIPWLPLKTPFHKNVTSRVNPVQAIFG